MSKLDDFLKQRREQAGMASATPVTPVDTGPTVRPRMTLEKFLEQRKTEPQVSPEVAQEVATAPAPGVSPLSLSDLVTGRRPAPQQAPVDTSGMPESMRQGAEFLQKIQQESAAGYEQIVGEDVAAATRAYTDKPITTSVGAITGLLSAGGEAIQQAAGAALGGEFNVDAVRATALEGQQLGKQQIAPVIVEEALPTMGAIAATAVAPEITIPMAGIKVAQWVQKAGAVGSILLAGATNLAGGTAGEFVEQVMRKEGFSGEDPNAPSTWSEVANRSITHGMEDAAWGAGFAAMGSMALGVARKILFNPKTSNQTFTNLMKEHQGPLLASDMSDAMVIRWAEVVAANTQQATAKAAYTTARRQQAAILEQAMGDVVTAEARKGGLEKHLTDYGDTLFKNLPSSVLADHVSTALRDSDKIAHSAIGVRYEALDDMLAGLGTTTKVKYVDEVVKDPLTGQVKYTKQPDPLFPGKTVSKPVIITRQITEEVPIHSVDITGAKKVLEDMVEKQANILKEGEKVQFRDFAARQVNLFRLKDELSYKEARDYLKLMRAESRTLARSADETAPTRRKFLEDSITELMGAMDRSAAKMSAEGINIDGMDVGAYLKDTNKLWREADEALGNPYVESVIKMSDKVEGAADSLALSFIQKSENSKNLLEALKRTETVAQMEQKPYAKELAGTVFENMSTTRAAISTKVAENVMGMLAHNGTRNKVLDMLSNVERRSDLQSLMGTDALEQVSRLTKAFTELEQSGIQMGSYMQLARETGAAIQTVEAAATVDAKGFVKGIAQVIGAPRLAAWALKSPDVIKLSSQLDYNLDTNTKFMIMTEIIHAGERMLTMEVERMTPEERQMMLYRYQLSQL